MQGIKIAVLLQQAAHLQAFLQCAHLRIFRHAVVHGDLNNNGEVLSHSGADRIQDLEEEGHAPLQIAAVPVFPLIPFAGQELVYQIAAVGMDFAAITAGGLGELGRTGNSGHQPGDLLRCKWRA